MEGLMRKILLIASLLALPQAAQADGPYRILKTVTVGGEGGFDYIVADAPGRRLYIARSGKSTPRLLAFDLDSLKPAGELDGISAHGAVVDPVNHHGFASSKPVTMFDSTDMASLKSIAVDGNPDGLTLDAAAHRVYVLSHVAPNITAINTADGSIVGTVNLDAAVEETQSDGKGHLYVALEDRDAVGVVDTRTLTVTARYPLAGQDGVKGGTPAGLALDARNRVLFVACRNPAVMVMMNADTGAILGTLPIGAQNDGVLFNPVTREALAATGDGHLTVIKQDRPGQFSIAQTLTTLSGARTIALDSKTGHIFLMTADYGPVPLDAPPPVAGRIARGPMLPGSFKIIEIGR
jgi:DNA-binding beta-propeller fold protein YncE